MSGPLHYDFSRDSRSKGVNHKYTAFATALLKVSGSWTRSHRRLSDDMRKTFNEFAAAYFGGIQTTFDEFEPVMVQHINDYLTIRTDFSTLQMTVFKNGIEVNWKDCSGLSLDGCGKLLLSLMMLYT